MQFDILTLFPESFASIVDSSILKRAIAAKKIRLKFHNFREFTTDKHRTVDDKPYGGGPGMVLKVEPILRCLQSIRRKPRSRVILLSPQGKILTQPKVRTLAKKFDQLIFICGHYEGFDERVRKLADEQLSVGPYVLTGGELPAAVIMDAVSRLLPGVLGKDESSHDESYSFGDQDSEYPHYTRPEVVTIANKTARVPRVLLSGDHQKIFQWRASHRRKPR
ncbi:MAG: tRNA (guanosine(37)-N1)-methyltransferase TrmD [Candidatus Kerfeldbacteria bacterium]|nr:tRNA (guanosine(37)-N1)-methyltransferase TrmD [Candidatus Kerfeldbacteria bacterium]